MILHTSTLSKTKEMMLMPCLDALKHAVTPRVLHVANQQNSLTNRKYIEQHYYFIRHVKHELNQVIKVPGIIKG
jgi:hypothetical protein